MIDGDDDECHDGNDDDKCVGDDGSAKKMMNFHIIIKNVMQVVKWVGNVSDGECNDDDNDCFVLAETSEMTYEELVKQRVVSR